MRCTALGHELSSTVSSTFQRSFKRHSEGQESRWRLLAIVHRIDAKAAVDALPCISTNVDIDAC